MGVVGGTKEYEPWRATMELTRGMGFISHCNGQYETRVEDGRQGVKPPRKFFDHTLQISGKRLSGYKDSPFSR